MPSTRPSDAAGERQQHAFGQQLADDAAAAGADRGADRDLALPAGGADQQQVGDVGAGDQQHEADRAEQHQQRRPHVPHELSLQRLRRRSRCSRRSAFGILRVCTRRPRAPAAPAPARASRPASSGRRPGNSGPGRWCADRAGTASRHRAAARTPDSRSRADDADDGVGLAAERDRLADDAADRRRSGASRARGSAPRPSRRRGDLHRR